MRNFWILLIIPMMMLFACGSHQTSNPYGFEEGETAELLKADKVYDRSKWIVGEDNIKGVGAMLQATILSDNYYVIDGASIALQYTLQIAPECKNIPEKISGLVSCSFAFVNLSPSYSASDVPLFATDGKNKELIIKWRRDDTDKFIMDANSNSKSLLWYYPEAGKFQKTLNKKEHFSVSVTLNDGKSLTYDFDTSLRDKPNIEAIE